MSVLIIKVSVVQQKRGFVDVWEAKPCKRGRHITLSSPSQAITTSKSKCFSVNLKLTCNRLSANERYLFFLHPHEKITKLGQHLRQQFLQDTYQYFLFVLKVLWFDENTSRMLKKVVTVLCFDNITFQV